MRSHVVVLCLLFPTFVCGQVLKRDTVANTQFIGTFAQRPAPVLKAGQAIPPDFYTKCFGFFCTQELKMQQAHIPVTFRMGSMEYVNKMEGKTKP